ncbi:hypothetical protein J7T55_001216 [Diaporthe amygdali]|uniref:uncharacterized protein n=1 Tax=Phomopsis amygdali TaxID=1214568 RepID=UPI0022FF1B3F|nr:uncharacterized protein J7T55_001216 [Diaporthe amygdali]KAJ0103760.1 hypothetical protein J7T55_001216 [Diaporthe amygdali]
MKKNARKGVLNMIHKKLDCGSPPGLVCSPRSAAAPQIIVWAKDNMLDFTFLALGFSYFDSLGFALGTHLEVSYFYDVAIIGSHCGDNIGSGSRELAAENWQQRIGSREFEAWTC